MLNQQIQNYKILSPLGEGGMAKVFLAEHNLLGSNTAIKLLNKEFTHNDNIRKRFLAEARSMARMSHPNIIKVSDLIDDGDTVAFVMEYVDGETLKECIDRKGKLSDEEIKSIFSQMLEALSYVHKQNLVHRDIKPSNFMIDPEGKVKLMDFGIAKTTDSNSAEYTQTGTGMQMGTPMYMSPEQITETKSVTFQSDIYSLGVVLWQMVTGEKPYDTRTLSIFQLQTKIVQEELQKSNSIWDSIIAKSTQKNPIYRYVTCSEVRQSIDQLNKCYKSNFLENIVASESIDLDEKTIVTLSPERSSKNYNVKIGDQNWMSKNLDVVTFRNGDSILEVKSMVDWENAIKNKKPAWCNYNFDPSNNDKFGKIYNWFAINDYRLLAPENYRIPSANDFKRLINFLGGMEVAGNKSRATKKNNFNDSRFSGVPGGYIDQNGFQRLDVDCAWWTDNQGKYENLEGNSKIFKLISKGLNYFFVESEATKKCGFSVRCIKGDPTKSSSKNKNLISEKTVVDSKLTTLNPQVGVNNSNSHETVKIGEQIWMTKNLDVDRFRNGDIIPEAQSFQEWMSFFKKKKPCWCYHGFDYSNIQYGKLYNWFSVSEKRGLAPTKFRIPTEMDFNKMIETLGGYIVAGNKVRSTKKNNFNSSNFSALPSGYLNVNWKGTNFEFERLNIDCAWWTMTYSDFGVDEYTIMVISLKTKSNNYLFEEIKMNKRCGFSVRCLID